MAARIQVVVVAAVVVSSSCTSSSGNGGGNRKKRSFLSNHGWCYSQTRGSTRALEV